MAKEEFLTRALDLERIKVDQVAFTNNLAVVWLITHLLIIIIIHLGLKRKKDHTTNQGNWFLQNLLILGY